MAGPPSEHASVRFLWQLAKKEVTFVAPEVMRHIYQCDDCLSDLCTCRTLDDFKQAEEIVNRHRRPKKSL